MKTEWISVKDKLPESTKTVLCVGRKGKHQFVGFYTKGKDVEVADHDGFGDNDCSDNSKDYCYLKPGWFEEEETPQSEYDYTYCHRNVTHWMPLPEPPKTESL